MGRCAFVRFAFDEVFAPKHPFDTSLEACYVYLEDGDERLILGAHDVSYMFRETSREMRETIARGTGVPVERVLIHELQHHSAPEARDMRGEPARRLAEKAVAALRPAMAAATECEVAWVVADVGERFNQVREQFLPDVGVVTVWGDYEFAPDGRTHTEDWTHMLLEGWRPPVAALDRPFYFDRPADPLVPLLVFRAVEGGAVLGTILRFAAHVVVVNYRKSFFNVDYSSRPDRDYRYSHDYPGYARRRLEEVFGGTAIYLNGPCGDLVPKWRVGTTFDEGRAEARRLGRELADAATAELQREVPAFAPLRLGGFATRAVELPMRDEIPRARAELAEAPARLEAAQVELRRMIDAGEWPSRIKRQADQVNYRRAARAMIDEWIGPTDDELARHRLRVELNAFGLNGLTFVTVPGESLTDTAQWLRNMTDGRRTVVVDQVNGYCSYMVTRERFDLGGYSMWGSILDRDAEPILRSAALEAARAATGGA